MQTASGVPAGTLCRLRTHWPTYTLRCSEVYAWGINDFGMLGNGTTSYATTPGACLCLRAAAALRRLACLGPGGLGTGARAWDHCLRYCGSHSSHGSPRSSVPTSCAHPAERVVGLEGVFIADVAAGGWHSMAISAEGGGSHHGPWLSRLHWCAKCGLLLVALHPAVHESSDASPAHRF